MLDEKEEIEFVRLASLIRDELRKKKESPKLRRLLASHQDKADFSKHFHAELDTLEKEISRGYLATARVRYDKLKQEYIMVSKYAGEQERFQLYQELSKAYQHLLSAMQKR